MAPTTQAKPAQSTHGSHDASSSNRAPQPGRKTRDDSQNERIEPAPAGSFWSLAGTWHG